MSNQILPVKYNVDGNCNFTISAEVSKAFREFGGYNSVFPNPDIKAYEDNGREYPYPIQIGYFELFTKLDYVNYFTKSDVESCDSEWSTPDEDLTPEEQEEQKGYYETVKAVLDQFLKYTFVSNQNWLIKQDQKEIPFDWILAYLLNTCREETFAFLNYDEFGEEAYKPIKVGKISFNSGGMFQPPSVNVKYHTYHFFNSEKYIRLESRVNMPVSATVTMDKTLFARNVDLEKLMERNTKIESLMGKACSPLDSIPVNANPLKPFHLSHGYGRLVPYSSDGDRYLLQPEVTEVNYEIIQALPNISDIDYLLVSKHPIEKWMFSRVVPVWSINYLNGALIPGDWLTEAVYDRTRIDKIFLSPKSKMELLAICSGVKNNTTYSDPFRKKSSNIILLEGTPGTGKTSSVLGISDFLETPLIHLNVSDLGSINNVARSLRNLLSLAEKFGAFVLLDEADAFITARSVEAFERGGIIASILKEMENFNGILMLTSNVKFSAVDAAIVSRLKHRISFPRPTIDQVRRVWEVNFANIKYDISEEYLDEIATVSWETQIDLRKITKLVSLFNDLVTLNPVMTGTIDIVSYVRDVQSDLANDLEASPKA